MVNPALIAYQEKDWERKLLSVLPYRRGTGVQRRKSTEKIQ